MPTSAPSITASTTANLEECGIARAPALGNTSECRLHIFTRKACEGRKFDNHHFVDLVDPSFLQPISIGHFPCAVLHCPFRFRLEIGSMKHHSSPSNVPLGKAAILEEETFIRVDRANSVGIPMPFLISLDTLTMYDSEHFPASETLWSCDWWVEYQPEKGDQWQPLEP